MSVVFPPFPPRQYSLSSLNAASLRPPPVVAMSYGRNQLAVHRAGPEVVIPSSWRRDSCPQQSHSTSAVCAAPLPGYSVNHAQYDAQRDYWSKQAYSTPPAETISLEISAVREGGNKRKGGRGVGFGVRHI